MGSGWLSFWSRKTRERRRLHGPTSVSGSDIYIPYGAGKVSSGDHVYCVAIEAGELIFFGRIRVGRIETDPAHNESLAVWADPSDPGDIYEEPTQVDPAEVDRIRFLKADGSESGFVRSRRGLQGTAFQGRASLRELSAGYEALDRLA